MWTEVSSSVPHFLHLGSFPIPIIHKCLLKVLRPVSRPITTLVWVLLRGSSRDPVAGPGPEINSRACLCILQVTCNNARCCFPTQRFNFLLMFCLEIPKKGSDPTNRWAEQSHSLPACRQFHSPSLQHAQGPNIAPQHAGQRCILISYIKYKNVVVILNKP